MDTKNDLIMHFFITRDKVGTPRRMEINLLPEKETRIVNERFSEYLRKEYPLIDYKWCEDYIPELYFYHYKMPAPENFPDLRRFDTDNGSLAIYLAEHGAQPEHRIPARVLDHLFFMNQEHTLPDLIRLGIVDRLTDYPDTREFMNSIGYFYTHDPFHELNAVETDKGVLFFEFSTYGRRDLQAFLQHIADNFHQKEGQSFKVVNCYRLMRPSKQEAEAFLNSSRPFSLYDGKFLPDKVQYQSRKLLEGEEPWRTFKIERNYDACHHFIDRNDLEYNVTTTQIQRLLALKEKGFLPSDEKKNRIPFLYQEQFEPFLTVQQKGTRRSPLPQKTKRQKIIETADQLLKGYFLESDSLKIAVQPTIKSLRPKM